MIFDFGAIKKSLQSLEARLQDIRNELLALRKKRDSINYAPMSREDVKTLVKKWVIEAGSSYTQSLNENIRMLAQSSRGNSGVQLRGLVTLSGNEFAQTRLTQTNQVGSAICALLQPALIDTLMSSVDAMEWPDNAIPAADRDQLISDLDIRIGKLQTEETELITKAQEAGLTLE